MGSSTRLSALYTILGVAICLVFLTGCSSNSMVQSGPPTPTPTPTPTPAPTANFLYSAGATPGPMAGVLETYKISAQTHGLTALTTLSFALGEIPQGLVTDTNQKFLLTAMTGGGTGNSMNVASYKRQADGSLTNVTFSTIPNTSPNAIAIDPLNRFFYIARFDNGSGGFAISVMRLDSTSGALSLASTFLVQPATAGVTGLGVDSSGSFLYAVLNDTGGASSIAELAIHSDGTLVQNGAAPVPGVSFLEGIFANSSNVYAGHQTGGVYAFSITTGSGMLTPVSGSPFATNAEQVLAFFQAGNFLYVGTRSKRTPGPGGSVILDPATIFAFQIQPGGALMPVAGSPFQPALDSLCFTSAGNSFLYVGDSSNIQGFSLDTNTGKLTSQFTTANVSSSLGCVAGP